MSEEAETKLAAWRQTRGLTLREVGDLAGLSTAMVSRLERGQRWPSVDLKVRMSRRLGARITDLFDPDERPPKGLAPATGEVVTLADLLATN